MRKTAWERVTKDGFGEEGCSQIMQALEAQARTLILILHAQEVTEVLSR